MIIYVEQRSDYQSITQGNTYVVHWWKPKCIHVKSLLSDREASQYHMNTQLQIEEDSNTA